MGIFNFLGGIFRKEPQTPYQTCAKTIKKMGYKKDGGSFYKDCSSGRTVIWLSNAGVKIKVYSGGYAESEFLPAPLPDAKRLKQFIRSNQL